MMQKDNHVFKGIKRDTHPIHQDASFLWDALNIRFTKKDNNSFLTMTNERGPLRLGLNIKGKYYLGHCILGKYLILFTTTEDGVDDYSLYTGKDYIIRITKEGGNYISEVLFEGALNFKKKHLIQTLGNYESPLVQKVYWTDGYNQPRFINIVADKLYNKDLSTITDYKELYPEGNFDFVPRLLLKEKIDVEKVEGGNFSPGTIQYAFTYYNKYGQESNIFYTTPLLYISPLTRGGNPEETVNNSFTIKIYNFETKFDYLRIYSIHRTSKDSTPQVKVVRDILISKDKSVKGLSTDKIVFTDTGDTGYSEDPTKLLYIGGEEILAECICDKDNTLFLGNITLKKVSIPDSIKSDMLELLEEKFGTSENYIKESSRTITLNSFIGDASNRYYSELNTCKSITSFRTHNYYRLGIQFQHYSGKWSEPIFLKDFKILERHNNIKTNSDGTATLTLNSLEFNINSLFKDKSTIKSELQNLGFVKVRGLVVLPKPWERVVVAQGVLNPTVFEVNNRYKNTPFAQASWFFRPLVNSVDTAWASSSEDLVRKVASRPYQALNYVPIELPNENDNSKYLNSEVQGESSFTMETINNSIGRDSFTEYLVDQSILTFNAPEIEFGEITKSIESENCNVEIIGGITQFSYLSDIKLTTSTPPTTIEGNYSIGFIKPKDNKYSRLYNEPLYESPIFISDNKLADSGTNVRWFIYPWQCGGSINNDINRDNYNRTSVLKSKTISNLIFSTGNTLLKIPYAFPNKIAKVSLFNDNDISLLKLNKPLNADISGDINYYGNVDDVKITKGGTHYVTNTVQNKSEVYRTEKVTGINEQYKGFKGSVRISYKSTPHLVIVTNYTKEGIPVMLPATYNSLGSVNTDLINGFNTPYKVNAITKPYWLNSVGTLPTKTSEASIDSKVLIPQVTLFIERREYFHYLKEYDEDTAILKVLGEYNSLPDGARALVEHTTTNKDWAWLYVRDNGNSNKWRVENPSNSADNKWVVAASGNGSNANKVYQYKGNIIEGKRVLEYIGKINEPTQSEITKDFKIYQDINTEMAKMGSFFPLVDLIRDTPINLFGGKSPEAIKDNLWLVGSEPIDLEDTKNNIVYDRGDTYYQRYDCLKTYAYAEGMENSNIEILSFMCDSYINLDGRYDKNRLKQSNLNVSPINFNLINNSYSQDDNIFNYRLLDEIYYKVNKYPLQVIWTSPHTALSDVDEWTHITLANSIDLNGDCGNVTSINKFNELLIAFQEHATIRLLYNDRVQISASDGVPIELGNSQKMQGTQIISNKIGCQDRLHTKETPQGIYFIDNNTSSFWLFNGSLSNIGETTGCSWWFREHNDNVKFPEIGSKILSYDNINNELYINLIEDKTINENSLCYSEKLGNFTSRMSYSNVIMDTLENDFISISTRNIEKYIEYQSPISIYSNNKGYPNYFFGYNKLPKFTFISNDNPTITKIFDTIEYKAFIDRGDVDTSKSTFDWIRAYNDYQDTGVKKLTSSIKNTFFDDASVQKKFRTWKAQLPRVNKMQRLRDSWIAIELGFSEIPTDNTRPDTNFNFMLYNISSIYSI